MDRHVSSSAPPHPTSPPPRRHSRTSSPSLAHHRDSQQYPTRERSREREQGFAREPPRAPRAYLQQTNPSPGPAPPGFGTGGGGPPSAGFGGSQSGHRPSYSSASGGYHQGMNRGGPPPSGPRARGAGVSPTSSTHPQGPGRGGAGSPVDERGRDYRPRITQGPDSYRQGRRTSPGWEFRGRRASWVDPGKPDAEHLTGRREGFPPEAGHPRGRSPARERYHEPYRARSREREFQRARSRSRERERERLRERERSQERRLKPARMISGNAPGGYGGYYDRDGKRGPPDAEYVSNISS